MCFMNCPYENWEGECSRAKNFNPSIAYCRQEEAEEAEEAEEKNND